MEAKGEFEQRPEAKPAEQVPFTKPKTSPLPWILCVVFALVAAGLGVFLALGAAKKDEKTNCVTAAENQNGGNGGSATNAAEDADLKLRKIVKGIESDLIDYFGYSYNDQLRRNMYEVEEGFDWIPVSYEFEKGYVTGVDKSYQVEFKSVDLNDFYVQKKTKNADFNDAYAKIMAKYGLSRISDEALKSNAMGYGPFYVFGDDSGNVCELNTDGEPIYVVCANTNTVSDEKKKLVKELIDAYKKNDEHAQNEERTYINADPNGIKKGKTDAYEIITGAGDGAAALFYRKDGGEWVYATSAQGAISCDEFKAMGYGDIFPCQNY